MKKISYALLGSALLATAATAMDAPAPITTFNGGYLGAKIGHSSTAMFQQYIGNALDVSVPGVTGGFFAGWGKNIGSSGLYLGLEVAYLMSNDTYKQTSQVKKGNAMEMAFRLGFLQAKNVLFFGKAGWVNSRMEVSPPESLALEKFSKRINGMLVGAGVDVALSSNILAGLEYTYAMYGNQKQNFPALDPQKDSVPGVLKPTSHTMTFRIAWRF